MLDVRAIRANPEALREAIRRRKVDPARADLDRWLALDEQRRQLQARLDELNAEKNKLAQLGRQNPEAARARGQEIRQATREIEDELVPVTQEWQSILDWFPNWPHPDMPPGDGPDDNVEECAWIPNVGYVEPSTLGKGSHTAPLMPQRPPHADDADFRPLPYWDLAPPIGGDTAQAAKVSGSRFTYLVGDIALLQLAIQRILTDKLLAEGFTPIVPPLLVRERALYGTSHFPEGRDQIYEIATEHVEEHHPLFLVGSSEPANFSYFMDRILPEEDLPIRVFASTSCFRTEVGSWGKDVRGFKRVHQFDKLEMCAVCTPDQSEGIYEAFRGVNEWLMQQLALPYHVVDKCAGDAGYLASHRQRDVEVWLTGTQEFMEIMTDTNTTDYQARRLNIRYRRGDGPLHYCHTVNDTGCAMGRMLIAILDNYQQKDGAIKVPEVLRPLVGKDVLRPKGA
jgi:seryl-tRNA synthetase